MKDLSKICTQSRGTADAQRFTVTKGALRSMAIAGMFAAAVSPAFAQTTTADVVGTATDVSGAVVPNATVTLTDVNTHLTRTVKAGSGGEYTFTLLNPGTYSLSVTASGFKTFQITTFNLSAGDRAREDAHLAVGSEGETVNVEATTPALRTDSAAIITTVTEKATQELPLNGRNFINLVQVTPGATEGLNNGLASGNRPDDRRQTSSISMNGQADMMNNQTIDGIDNNERVIGSIGVRPSVDSIQEVSVQTNVFTAEVGRAAGAIVNVITKSGSNQFHGTLYEFFRHDKLNANPFKFGAAIPKPKYRQNQFGGSIGGPIFKDKTFFFADYEGLNKVFNQNPSSTTVPTLFERNNPGNFTDNPGINTIVPAANFDKVAQQYFNLFPLPNTGTAATVANNYTAARPDSQFSKVGDVRGDQRFKNGDLFYIRYTYNRVDTSIGSLFPAVNSAAGVIFPGGNLGSYPGPALTRAHQAHLNYVHSFTPNVLLELKAGYTLLDNAQFPLNFGKAINSAFGQPNLNVDGRTAELSAINVTLGGATLGNRPPIIYHENTYQYEGNVTYIKGKQIIKVGGGVIRRQDSTTQTDTANGNWVFDNFAKLLSGDYNTAARNQILYTPHNRTWEPHVYFQDDYHATQNLTLNLGVRYDLFTPYTETNNILSNFDIVQAKFVVAGINADGHGGIKTDYSNFAPRFGFAYTPLPKTVIRGGFGLTFAPENTTSGAALVNQPFTATLGPYTQPNAPAGFTKFASGMPTPTANPYINPTGSATAALDPNFKSTYIEQFNLTVEREFAGFVGTLSYVGELGRRNAYYLSDFNTIPLAQAPQAFTNAGSTTAAPVATSTYNSLRRFANTPGNSALLGIPLYRSTGASSYHGMQAVLKRRFSKGLDLQVAYTQSRLLDNSESISNNGGNGFGSTAELINSIEYGNGNLDMRSRITGTFNYALPFGQNTHGFVGVLAKGWQANGIVVWGTGLPFSVTNAANRSGTRPTATNSDRALMIGNGRVGHPTITKWFDTNSFVWQALGTTSTQRRNQLYGPGIQRVDLSLFKNFDLTERFKLEFRTEAFNVLNTAQFVNPSASLNYAACTTACNGFPVAGFAPAAGYGAITATGNAYNPRLIQFAARVKF
ncbi:TonB-dependent receptor [Terriglobus roseus]|uniref:Carboxypeptidase regulatory-like domain-containing protein n=1 Tax=Terriglobus roseus TaxID=392734 RepID=A0A1G7PIS0_9BACT|nr:carboxypeptidase regulatory-like domain-containing protein [Terriglobus roseus]SDF86014.1 Carboxypeptidase regulatory-like domain-containing protein [Terriglobus roseus]